MTMVGGAQGQRAGYGRSEEGAGRTKMQVRWEGREGQVCGSGELASTPLWTSAPWPELFAPFPPFILNWAPLSPWELVSVATGSLRSASTWFSGGGQV